MDLMRTISEKTAIAPIIPDQYLDSYRCGSGERASHLAAEKNPPYLAGHVRVSEIWVPVRRDPPKIIAHHPILVERASCPQRPCDCNYGGKGDHASEADQHNVEIIAWNLCRPTRPSRVS